MLGYAVANLIGLAIVVTAFQFYRDIRGVFDDKGDSILQHDYVSLSHRVGGFGSLASSTATGGFTDAEIADIASQSWVRRVGKYTSARYNVAATIDMSGQGSMSTALFFESIPDEFIDIRPTGWDFNPSESVIPVILSKDYLTLYNFGFASSRGLPKLSEALIGVVPLRVSLSGNGRQAWYPAQIVGFSSRLNTIAVPESFMLWANEIYGDSVSASDSLPNRLIVELSRPGAPEIEEYLDSHDLDMSGGNADNASASYFLRIVTSIVMTIGVVITLLAFFILTLSLWLLLSKNREKLFDLMQLGYTPRSVSLRYYIMVCTINVIVMIGSLLLLIAARGYWTAPLATIGTESASVIPTVVVAVVIMAVITLCNLLTIRNRMRSYFRK